ncbi:unnamed protein product [Amoebophrya sp. A25]|nr:unnamed protein product [Amoebophrya sp. A25]|eukprot:GSA25T00027228001.1
MGGSAVLTEAELADLKELKARYKTSKDSLSKEEKNRLKELRDRKTHDKDAKTEAKVEERVAAAQEEIAAKKRKSESDTKRNASTAGLKKPRELVVTEEQIEPVNEWWKHVDDDSLLQKDAIRWQSLEHHGILFPAPYQPHKVPLLYGKSKEPLVLPPVVEELATYWCANIGLEAEKKDLFINNFWGEFSDAIKASGDKKLISKVKMFRECDFSKIHEKLIAEREAKKHQSKEYKEREKEMRLKQEEKFRYCLIDGFREKVGNIRVEPPGLFKGRGEHPKQGKLKDRIMPENVTMNCDNCLAPPICTVPGRAWEQVVHDDSVNWLGYYKQETDDKENIKYIQMDKTSEIKCRPDLMKYERARRLCDIVGPIRRDYQFKITHDGTSGGVDSLIMKKQLGTAAYFIDRLALRVGGEKNTEEEADTVGCTSLRVEHVKLDFLAFKQNKPKITLDFLGKDSIRYLNEVPVPPSVFKNLALFMKNKKPNDQLFDRIQPSDVNTYLQEFMPDLTAKVFRTYNASFTLEQQLAKFNMEDLPSMSQVDLAEFYNEANKKVAILCNHQKAVSKGHEEGVEKLKDRFEASKERIHTLKQHLHLQEKGQDGVQYDENAPATFKLPKNKTATAKAIASEIDRNAKLLSEMNTKESNKNVSLTTSKINYMDPRITIAFCKRTKLDISKVFSKTIQQKFPWAMDVVDNYSFVKAANGGAKRPAAQNGAAPDAKRQKV